MTEASARPERAPAPPLSPPLPERVESVDVLRGFDMFWIIGGKEVVLAILVLFVHPLPGWLEYHFEHVRWEGFSAWDLIMPLFLFIVGVAMPFSVKKRVDSGQPLRKVYWKVIRRTVILFVLGMAAQGHLLDFNLDTLHIYCNTLQAIAAGYLVASIALIHLSIRGQAILTALLLVAFWLLLAFVPVPGHGMGVLEPDANLALWVDDVVLRGFSDGTPYTWVLSSLGFAASVLLGVFAGHLLHSGKGKGEKLLWLVAAGLGCLAAGWAWSLFFPIIKHVWTSSMVLWAAGWSFLLLALFYLVVDIIGFKCWAFPFKVVGMNALFAYTVPHVFDLEALGSDLVGGLARHLGEYGEYLVGLTAFLMLWGVLLYMYRKGTFVRV